eukprot:scaffold1822_cov105-Isochrysis_galbana.AAC.2
MYKTTVSPRRRRQQGTRVRVRKSVESTGEERASVGQEARRTGGDRERRESESDRTGACLRGNRRERTSTQAWVAPVSLRGRVGVRVEIGVVNKREPFSRRNEGSSRSGGRACREPAPPQRGRPRSLTWSPAHETCERTSSAESAGGESDRISGQKVGGWVAAAGAADAARVVGATRTT